MAIIGSSIPRLGAIERATGAFLVVVGVLMLTGAFSDVSFWLLDTFPVLARIG